MIDGNIDNESDVTVTKRQLTLSFKTLSYFFSNEAKSLNCETEIMTLGTKRLMSSPVSHENK